MPKISELNIVSGSISGSNLFLYGIDISGSASSYGKISGSNIFTASNLSGWVDALQTWTYATETTFTVTGDVTEKYQVGTKLRWKEGGSYKYAYVLSASYGASTTVTLTGGSDYSLAGGAITDNYYSYTENPQGFPGGFTYTPVWRTASDPQPAIVNGSAYGYFSISGRTVTFYNQFTFGSSSTFGNGYFYFGLPTLSLAMAGQATGWKGTVMIFDSGTSWRIGVCYYVATVSSNLYVCVAVDSAADLTKSNTPITFTTNDIISIQMSYGI